MSSDRPRFGKELQVEHRADGRVEECGADVRGCLGIDAMSLDVFAEATRGSQSKSFASSPATDEAHGRRLETGNAGRCGRFVTATLLARSSREARPGGEQERRPDVVAAPQRSRFLSVGAAIRPAAGVRPTAFPQCPTADERPADESTSPWAFTATITEGRFERIATGSSREPTRVGGRGAEQRSMIVAEQRSMIAAQQRLREIGRCAKPGGRRTRQNTPTEPDASPADAHDVAAVASRPTSARPTHAVRRPVHPGFRPTMIALVSGHGTSQPVASSINVTDPA